MKEWKVKCINQCWDFEAHSNEKMQDRKSDQREKEEEKKKKQQI
jgi:hypothetical protein